MMDLESFLVSLYVLMDNWWQDHHCCTVRRSGRPTLLSDREVLTLAILSQWPRFRSERDFYRFAETYLREYFPITCSPRASSRQAHPRPRARTSGVAARSS